MAKEILKKPTSVKINTILQKANESPERSNWKLKIADANKKQDIVLLDFVMWQKEY